jgi:hypothetical protein
VTPVDRRVLPLLPAAAAIILLHQGLDLLSRAAELDLGTATGRILLATTVWSRVPALLAADAFLVAAAILSVRARPIRVLGLVHIVAGFAALVAASFYLVDAGRIAGGVPGAELASFRLRVARMLVGPSALGLLGLVGGLGLRNEAKPQGGSIEKPEEGSIESER